VEVVRKLNVQLLGSISKPFDRSIVAFMVRRIRGARNQKSKIPTLSRAFMLSAIEEQRLEAYFQPIINGDDNSVHSIEALSRFRDKNKKTILPETFIPSLERHKLFPIFMPLALTQIFKGYKYICEQFSIHVPLRINLHQDQLAQSDLPTLLHKAVVREGIRPESIVLEISERFPQGDIQLRNVARLRIAGFCLSLDDYGTGYTNIRQLGALPFGDIKIDSELVTGMQRDRALRAIIESIKQVADELSIEVIAEGVHHPSDLIMLDTIGIHLLQGYFFSRPKPAEECVRWLRKWQKVIKQSADKRGDSKQ
jgi:EAL domain-containing protein (putative c-di-GMP-specific phosphodiesterase class I)